MNCRVSDLLGHQSKTIEPFPEFAVTRYGRKLEVIVVTAYLDRWTDTASTVVWVLIVSISVAPILGIPHDQKIRHPEKN